ncbi:hypothetical protein CC86DRAFT_396585 [Ophiobolus disseminans]|uniref:Uncharacterized protein n=1 Tax=Ophiobolus disseminans TaxID=1469910 RepID=A0A6A6ZQJ5_9PLEO|nr:hypothetical protein CC86DRAFT_396585 [Ophiobolus disseminans]
MKNARTNKARKRRKALLNTPVHIGGHYERRILKRSARKQLEKEHASQLWIFPWMGLVHTGSSRERIYPQAHLLGLPTELRQHILHLSYSMKEVESDTKTFEQERKTVRPLKGGHATQQKTMLEQLQLKPHEAHLVTILGRRIGSLSQVSPIFCDDMKYVSKLWQRDLERHLNHSLQLRLDAPRIEGYDWLYAPNVAQPDSRQKEGHVIQAKSIGSGKRVRPPKCWYCTERHYNNDPVCPMARRDPKRWENMTKRVGGWREKPHVHPTFKGSRIVFDT